MNIRELLIRHEGLRLAPYQCTSGRWTIGVGYNYQDRGFPTKVITRILREGFTQELAYDLLDNDIAAVRRELVARIPWYANLSEDRRTVLEDMAFNLGTSGLMKFKRFLAAMESGKWEEARKEMLDSRWAIQVGRRAQRLSEMV